MLMMREAFDWLKPSLLWGGGGIQGVRQPDFFQPQILEFNDDKFMNLFLAAATSSNSSAFQAAVVGPSSAQNPVKLYQPAHGCFYLACAALSCRMPGFPQRMIARASGESVFFVMRKFVQSPQGGAYQEFGWVPVGGSGSWQALNGLPRQVLDGEERRPMFPVTGSDGRTILVGYLPVANSGRYAVTIQDLNNQSGWTAAEINAFPNGIDLRIEEFEAKFTTPLTTYLKQTQLAQAQAPDVSVYMLLDLWEFFGNYLPDVAIALKNGTTTGFSGAQAAAEQALMGQLSSMTLGGASSLAAALGMVAQQQVALEQTGGADLTTLGLAGLDVTQINGSALDALESAVQQALPPNPPAQAASIELPQGSAPSGTYYALRCVYERPQCSPPLRVVSLPSIPFRLAAFFESDAPARPVRIVMPTDVSLAGLRKFNKGVTFLISGSLQQRIARLTGRESTIITGTAGNAGVDIGWMCTYSIQIIFIVAFFLLLMFVIIFNLVFFWIALFKICIPVPQKFTGSP